MTATQDDDEQRWLDTLAGRRAPATPDERRAAALRQVLLAEADALEPDEAQLQRIRNAVEARMAAAAASTPAPQRNPLAAAWNWLFPEGGVSWRGAVAAGLLAAVAAPLVMQLGQAPSPQDSDVTTKGLPPLQAPADGIASLPVADPAAVAAQVQAALASLDIPATQQAEGTSVLLSADVPAERQAEAAQALQALEVALPADGKLRLRLTPKP